MKLTNRLIRVMVRLVWLCHQYGVPAYIENPLTSRLWIFPEIQALVSSGAARLHRIDFCQFGTPWKKGTRLLEVHDPSLSSALRVCTRSDGPCCRAGKPHITLQGVDAQGVFRIARAEPYPKKLCAALAKHIHALR